MSLLFLYGCSGGASTSGAPPGGGAPGGRGGRRGGAAGDVPVTVAVASQKDVPVEVQVIGNVEAYSTISVKAQVGGQLTIVSFKEGDYVKTGDLLFTIDQRPLEAALSLATANVAKDEASLGQAQANLSRDTAQNKYTEANAARYAELFQAGVVSKDQSEQLRASADASGQALAADKAAIASAQAAIGASKAAIDNARVQLSYTSI
ncbi:MAG TPA: biotin/lipoyl-binding protein, partial [Candidatus Limnocylindrales bacterium]|nr:biotin/lipoyl-binding protein [Candidatus Limnocylindrales bacterium]